VKCVNVNKTGHDEEYGIKQWEEKIGSEVIKTEDPNKC